MEESKSESVEETTSATVEAVETQRRQDTPMEYRHEKAPAIAGEAGAGQSQGATPDEPFVREGRKVGRNEACPCGSGKKFKQCHGKLS